MKRSKHFMCLMVMAYISLSFSQKSYDSLVNEDNHESIQIGSQLWMKENLNASSFRNGDPILEAKTKEEWVQAGYQQTPAWCYYDNDHENGKKYGKLYNWYAVDDPRGLAPEGWHIPSEIEWEELTTYLGGKEETGSKIKNITGWKNNDFSSNESGFSGLPGGIRKEEGTFKWGFGAGYWWSSTSDRPAYSWYRGVNYYSEYLIKSEFYKQRGVSVRCLKD